MKDLTPAGLVALFGFGALLIVLPFVTSGYVLSVAIICLYLAFVGQAWNLMLGFAGLLSIGHALFVGLGAYTSGYLFTKFDVPPVIGVAAAVAVAMVMGAVIGYLGFRFAIGGVYFALLTIAFSEFVRILIDHAKFLGGTEGLFLRVTAESRRGVDLVNLRGWPEMYYYVMLALAAGAFLLCYLFLNSRAGYYWRAIRDNPEAAEAVGVDIFRFRMFAVLLSSGMAGVAGVFYAFYYNNLFPEQVLSIEKSIEITLAPIVGGVGTLFGPIFGAFVLTPMGEGLTGAIESLKSEPLIGPHVNLLVVRVVLLGIVAASMILMHPRLLRTGLSWLESKRLVRPNRSLFGARVLLAIVVVVAAASAFPGVLEWAQKNTILSPRFKGDGVKLMFWGFAVALIVLLKPTGLWPWVCQHLRLVKAPGQRS